MPVLTTPIDTSFIIDQYTTRRLDYFCILKNHFYPDLDDSLNITGSKGRVPFYDALLYCNSLSQKESLEPVYSFIGLRSNTSKELMPDLIVSTVSEVRADFSRNGYRIPTLQELERAIADTAIIVDGPNCEWVWHGTSVDSTVCAGFFYYNHLTGAEVQAPSQTGGVSKAFRLVTDIPDTIIITGYGENLKKYAIAAKTILMYDAFFDPGDQAKYYAGENIFMRDETDIPEGAEVLLKTD